MLWNPSVDVLVLVLGLVLRGLCVPEVTVLVCLDLDKLVLLEL